MNDKIQELIDLTLGDDGYISPKETDFIIRKAKELGEDPEEVLMCINVANAKAERANQEERQKAKGMSCPWCNMTIPELSEECPYCHKKITARASQELEEIIDNLECALIDLKAGKDIAKSKAVVERFTRKAQLKYSENPKIKNLIADIETETIAAEKRALKTIEQQKKEQKKLQKKEERKELLKGFYNDFIKNQWFWIGALFILGALLMILGISAFYSLNVAIVGEVLILAAVVLLFYKLGSFERNKNKIIPISVLVALLGLGCYSTYKFQEQIWHNEHEAEEDVEKKNKAERAKEILENYNKLSEQVEVSLKSGQLGNAKTALINTELKTVDVLAGKGDRIFRNPYLDKDIYIEFDNYELLYFKVVKAYLEKEEYDSVEELLLDLKRKVTSSSNYDESNVYKLVKQKFKEIGRDFSLLKSKYDHDDDNVVSQSKSDDSKDSKDKKERDDRKSKSEVKAPKQTVRANAFGDPIDPNEPIEAELFYY